MRKITTILLSLITILSCMSAQAAPNPNAKWYQVELIVFSHITAQGLNSEKWSWTNPQYAVKSTVLKPYITRSFLLNTEEAQLNKDQGYKVILHTAWRQQIQHPRYAKPIHIFGGKVYNASGKVIATDPNAELPYNNSEIWQVNGTIKISVRRYFDLNMNLLFANPTAELTSAFKNNKADNVQGRFAYFRLLQSRRMRSKELNYIGHPLYGILVKVIPVNG